MSDVKNTVVPEMIHLNSIRVFKSNIETSDDFLENSKKVNAYEFGIAKNIAHDHEKGGARFRLFFSFNGLGPDGNQLGIKAEYGIEFHFLIENYDEYKKINKSNKEIQIDAALGATLLAIAYSTSRGIILERTQGTFFEAVILPVIDPFKLLIENDA